MKTLGKIIIRILVCLVLVLLVLRVTGLDPRGLRPGLWLKGNVVTTPVTDWSFTDNIPTILIQTRTWYLLPHSVTIDCSTYNGHLYLSTVYRSGVEYSVGRRWNDDLLRDLHVRIKIGNQLYDRRVSLVTDQDEKTGALQAKAKKYPELKINPRMLANVFRVLD
jgi:hypothetical protein